MKTKTVSSKIINFSSGKVILVLAALYISTQISMLLIVLPIMKSYSSITPLDMKFYCSPTEMHQFLASLVEHGRNVYSVVLLYDMLFPMIYATFYTTLTAFLIKKLDVKRNIIQKLVFVPLFAGLFDILENVCFLAMIKNFPKSLETTARIGNTFTMLKWTFGATGIFALIVLIVALLFSKKMIADAETSLNLYKK